MRSRRAAATVVLAASAIACGLATEGAEPQETGTPDASARDSTFDHGLDAPVVTDAATEASEDAGAEATDTGTADTLGPDAMETGDAPNMADASDAMDGATAASDADAADGSEINDAVADRADVQTLHAITEVQAIAVPYTLGHTLSTLMSVTGGDLLVLTVFWGNGNNVSVTDTLGNTWRSVAATTPTMCSSSGQIWYAENASGGSDTINVTAMNASSVQFMALEYSGVATAAALDSQSGQSAASMSNAMTAGSLTTTTSLDVIVAGFADLNGAGTMTAGNGFTARGTNFGYFSLAEDDLPGVAPGSYDPSASLPSGDSDNCWTAVAAAFKAK